MEELAAMRVYLKVAASGSFSDVARELGVSVSSVTRQVNTLEKALGVRLLSRSTRQLALTEAGSEYCRHVALIVRDVENARRAAIAHQEQVKGTINVHAVASAGAEIIVPALRQFLEEHTQLRINLTLTDEKADLLSKGIDVAVWLGNLPNSSLVARTLNMSQRLVCASPEYFERYGVPKVPQDLLNHNCLVYRSLEYLGRWRFLKDGESTTVEVAGNVQSGNGAVLLECARNGMGIAVMPTWMARSSREQGRLQVALTEYQVLPAEHDDTAIYVVYPHRERLPPKVRLFVDFLIEIFRE